MCQLAHDMYEGKNIHYSVVDNKPLCSFSSKQCNQRRLNGFGFCVRHILEDPTAPFRRCAYVAKSSNQMCTQAIPKHEERRYCNNHMQVLGMLPRKERKPKKEKETNTVLDNRLPFRDRMKSKNNMTKLKSEMLRNKEISLDDPDDPYAFPDPVKDTPLVNNQTVGGLPLNEALNSPVLQSKPTQGGTSSIARLYPELAEKLEKIRPKIEPRVVKEKGRIRSSRTMNKLQTKIAQNKIKDKLRKSQESGSNASVSPASMPSPDQRDMSPGVMQPSPLLEGSTQASGVAGHAAVLPGPVTGLPCGSTVAGPSPPSISSQRTVVPSSAVVNSPFDGAASRESVKNITGFQQTFNHSSISQRLLSSHILPPPYPGTVPLSSSQTPLPPITAPTVSAPVPAAVKKVSTSPPQLSTPSVLPPPDPVVEQPLPQLPPPPPYVAPQISLPVSTASPKITVLLTRPQRLKNIFSAKDARTCLKSESAVNYYSFYAKRKLQNRYLINHGLCSSDDEASEDEDVEMLPWQPEWFSASSDEENNEDDPEDDLPLHVRATKLALLRARLRRQCNQSRTATRSNTRVRRTNNQATLALVKAIRDNSCAALRALWKIIKISHKPVDKYKKRGLEHRPCLIKDSEDVQCKNRALPYTNHCLKHVMYNVEQQLFDYCTAKFADNTQCCVPVFDIRHELPLCAEHGAKADNYQKTLHMESRKRPRKKTKPPALTRPPRKGKKKKKSRYVRPQKPVPESGSQPEETALPEEETGEESGSNVDVDVETTTAPVAGDESDDESDMDVGSADVSTANTSSKDDKTFEPALSGVALDEMLPPGRIEDIGKAFGELPLEQASRLLEEQDFQEVFNKIPDDAFDIFSGRNGEFEPSTEETEELERALAEATKDVYSAKDTLEKLLKGDMSVEALSEELSRSIAESLSAQFASNSAMDGGIGKSTNDVTSDCGGSVHTQLRGPVVAGSAAPTHTGTMPTALTAQLLHRVHGLNPVSGGVVLGHSMANRPVVFSGSNTLFTTVPSSLAGFTPAVSVVGGRTNSMAMPNRTSVGTSSHPNFTASQAALTTLAGYHGNLPYTALTQQLALSPQTSTSALQKTTSSSMAEHLRVDSAQVLSHVTAPQQQQQQQVTPAQAVNPTHLPWPSPAVSGASVIYENGFPLSRMPFVQTVNLGNQVVGKFPVQQHAQTSVATADYSGKQDAAQFSLTHSMGALQHPTGSLGVRAAVQPPLGGAHNSVQGYMTNFALGRPPFTSSSTGS
ncbi:INO80 complex subunit D-like [Gigantopelta aegis]|uniref:INO80 complex subunit D-like n=1 Tax=Gigantopelta aegis TaxID=1735272 RepID=UPI001B887906|nr:INO80 complex subunit D-like [Gigantopelta aegis]